MNLCRKAVSIIFSLPAFPTPRSSSEREVWGSKMIKLIPAGKSLSSHAWASSIPITSSPHVWCSSRGGHVTYSWAHPNDLWALLFAHVWSCGTSLAGPAVSPHICWLIGNPNVQDSTGDQRGDMWPTLDNSSCWKQRVCDTDFCSFQITLYKWSLLCIFWKDHGTPSSQRNAGQETGAGLLSPFWNHCQQQSVPFSVSFPSLSFVFLPIPRFPLPLLLYFFLPSFCLPMSPIPRSLRVKFWVGTYVWGINQGSTMDTYLPSKRRSLRTAGFFPSDPLKMQKKKKSLSSKGGLIKVPKTFIGSIFLGRWVLRQERSKKWQKGWK